MRKVLFVLGMMISFFVNGQWSVIGSPGSSNFNSYIYTIATYQNSLVYVAGNFQNTTTGKYYVAQSNGGAWTEVGGVNNSPFNNIINKIVTDVNGNLYAAGVFRNAMAKYYVAKWDGNSWSEVGGTNSSTFNGGISDLFIDTNGNVYAVGGLKNANNKFYVAKWDGSNWSEVGGANTSVFGSTIFCIYVDNSGNVYVGGQFLNAMGKNYVAKWDGNNWSELGGTNSSTFNLPVKVLTGDAAGNLYATGSFYNGNNKNYVAKWDGGSWSEVGGSNTSTFSDIVNTMVVDVNNNLYTGGRYTNTTGKYYVGKWDGNFWSQVGYGTPSFSILNGYIYGMGISADGSVYIGGQVGDKSGNYYVCKYTQSLPLKLLSFTGKQQQNNVLLNWHTANEVNVSHINIQRSSNGKDFTTIGKVNASCCSYSFIDNQLPITNDKLTLYYRLEIIDKDGSKTYSSVNSVQLKVNSEIKLYPNPAKEMVTIECAGTKELFIIDYLGRTIKQYNHPTPLLTLNSKLFTKGVYIVKAIMSNGDVKTEELVVE